MDRMKQLRYVSVDDWILAAASGRSVLHLGCAGEFLELGPTACLHYNLSKTAKVLWGVEINGEALAQVKNWVPEQPGRFEYLEADVQRLEIERIGRKFEMILAGSIIEHLSNPGLMLQSFAKLLEADGRLVIVTPHVYGLLSFQRVALRRHEAVNPEHTCWFSICTLSELCFRYGFIPVEYLTGYGWRPPSLKWTIQRAIGGAFFRRFPQVGGSLIGVFALDNGPSRSASAQEP